MQTGYVSTPRLLEIACDESGFEGTNFVSANTDVFAHASVQLSVDAASHCIQEVRGTISSSAREYKANRLLREKHRSVLKWLLGPSGPIHGKAHVHLTHKTFFVVSRVIDLLIGEITSAAMTGLYQDQQDRDMAVTLHRDGSTTFGPEQWQAFLAASNDLVRSSRRRIAQPTIDAFFRTVDGLRIRGRRGPVDDIMQLIQQARPSGSSLRAQLLDDPRLVPALDPLIPGIVQAVAYWSTAGSPVAVVHDEQSAITGKRIAQLDEIFSAPPPALLRHSPAARMASLRLVDSRTDSRVQVADLLAGAARKIASEELNGRGDPELTALLRPYVDTFSIWGDDRSWARLTGQPQVQQVPSGVGVPGAPRLPAVRRR